MSGHYRSQLNYSEENLKQARSALERLYTALRDGQIRRRGGWRSLRSTLYRGDGRRLQHPGSLFGAVRYGA
jgi:cysteinyl-tRNA synthetase